MDKELMNILKTEQIPFCHSCGPQEVFLRSLRYNDSIAPNGFILLSYSPNHLIILDEFNVEEQENHLDICLHCGADLINNIEMDIEKEFNKVGFQI